MGRYNMNPVMYLFLNKGTTMSKGKACAQIAHAACLAQRGSKKKLVDDWYKYGFYTKLVLQARDGEHIKNIKIYLEERGIKTFMVIDEGRTEIPRHTITALGCEVVDKDVLGPIFEAFKLYREKVKVTLEMEK